MEAFEPLLEDCMNNYDVLGDDKNADWPNNIISRHAIWDDKGILRRPQDPQQQPVSAEEVELCQQLATKASELKGNGEVGMGSSSWNVSFVPFWLVARSGEPVPTRIDDELIRSRFGNTLFPPTTIDVEPLEESGLFWDAIVDDLEGSSDERREEVLQPWRRVMAWMRGQEEFKDGTFAFVGHNRRFWKLRENDMPPGTELTPSCHPRLMLSLTTKGSLCGLFGYVVQN